MSRCAWASSQKVMCCGVTRKANRGIPKCLIQEPVKSTRYLERVRGTLKVARLVGDPECEGMFALSLYDQKPFYYLTNAAENIKWLELSRNVWSHNLNKMISLPYHKVNVIHDYNNDMNHVDIADQLREHYRIDRWMRKRKWWWSVFFWAYEMLLTNSYILYCKFYEMHSLKPMSHYQYQKEVALSWIDPKNHWKNFRKKKKQTRSSAPISAAISPLTLPFLMMITQQQQQHQQ